MVEKFKFKEKLWKKNNNEKKRMKFCIVVEFIVEKEVWNGRMI